jgi:23S rRNA (uracil1939-C5)-methyltransferase
MDKKKMTCPVEKKCGGCRYLNLDYSEELKNKEDYVRRLIKPYCRLSGITGMEDPFFYRNKVTRVFGMEKGKPVYGIFEEKSHRIVKTEKCLIEDERADAIINSVWSLLRSFKIRVYDEDTRVGLLRYVMVRTGRLTGEVMVTLVTASPVFPSKQNFCKALKKLHPEITTIVQNVNSRTDSLVLSDKENVLYGKGFIEDELCGKRFKISSKSFYQVNPIQTEILYRKAVDYAGLTGKERVLDAYSGIGTIGIIASDKAKEVISVELNGDAVKDAKINASANKIKNISFYKNDAGKFMVDMAKKGEKVDVVFMDPPRQGSSEDFIKALLIMKPKRIVYVSCGPETLARDLKLLTSGGYKVESAECVDMFPKTEHVETVVLLSQQKPDDHIEIEINLDEIDATGAETKATYKKIQNWVQEKYGFHVTNLNIAQVKQRHGIIERENYNKPKSEDSRQPRCPEEKVKAIEDALRHFQMI